MEANRQHDHDRYLASGVSNLSEALTRFLLNEKQTEFLLRMWERVAEALADVQHSDEEAERLRLLRQEIAQNQPSTAPLIGGTGLGQSNDTPRFSACSICDRIDRGMYRFLCQYQYNISVRGEAQTGLADHGGLCSFHTWQYEAMASPRGSCLGFSTVLDRLAGGIRQIATNVPAKAYAVEIQKLRPTPTTCDLCRARTDMERSAVVNMARSLTAANSPAKDRFSGLCLDHLRLVIEAIEPGDTTRDLLLREADVIERISEDMRRYVLKHDGVRRFLASAEELSADQRALMLLAGHRNVNGLWKWL